MNLNRRRLLATGFAAPIAGITRARAQSTPSSGTPVASPVALPLEMVWWFDLWRTPTLWSPIFDAGRTYFTRSGEMPEMRAIDLATGDTIWSTLPRTTQDNVGRFEQPPRLITTVVITQSRDGQLCGFDTATGEPLWQVPINDVPGIDGAIGSTYSLGDGRIVGWAGSGLIYALDERTAAPQWAESLPIGTPWMVTDGPALTSTGAYFFDNEFRLHGVDVQDGSLMWSRAMAPDHYLVYPYGFKDSVILNLERQGVMRIDPETGDDVWQNETFLGRSLFQPTPNGSALVGLDATLGEMAALDMETGKTLWARAAGDRQSGVMCQALNDRWLAFAERGGTVRVLDVMSGEPVYESASHRVAAAYPQETNGLALHGDRLFIAADDHFIYVIDLGHPDGEAQIAQALFWGSSAPANLFVHDDVMIAHVPLGGIGAVLL